MLNMRAGISDETVRILSAACREKKPAKMVDLGTGSGYSLKAMIDASPGSQIWTVENDPARIVDVEMVLGLLVDLSLVKFIHSPIGAPLDARKARGWYQSGPLEVIPSGIDILFVDGPEGEHGRHPALPFFLSRMSRPSIVFLDDCNRPEEHEILLDWSVILTRESVLHRTQLLKTDRGLGRIDIHAPMR